MRVANRYYEESEKEVNRFSFEEAKKAAGQHIVEEKMPVISRRYCPRQGPWTAQDRTPVLAFSKDSLYLPTTGQHFIPSIYEKRK